MEALVRSGAPSFEDTLARHGRAPLEARAIEVLQVNVGKLCNQTCAHCHVDAGPDRREVMSHETAQQVIELLRRHPEIPTLDITGGAPELNPQFPFLVTEAVALGRRVIDRCNLSVLLLPSQRGLVGFLKAHRVEVTASLPSFRPAGTDAQRGDGVFAKSLEALRALNEAGYGEGTGLVLNLVHNPVGAFLPGDQSSLERDYKRELQVRHGIVFDSLFTITNMPISRFLEHLERTGNLERYMDLLVASFNPRAADGVMCRTYLSVGWDGTLYDCDFNQMLEIATNHGAPRTLGSLLASGGALPRRVVTGRHCFGCTAGAGSSCGGAVAG
jgi:radical SAM/Cys-rich protein